jgi:hypothetical protein
MLAAAEAPAHSNFHRTEESAMLNAISRATALAAALMSLVAVLASTAGATTTWDTNKGSGSPAYNGTFTATAGPVTLAGAAGFGLACTGATETGILQSNHHAGATWANAVTGTLSFSSCKSGGTSYGVHCTYGMNATSFSGGVTSIDTDFVVANGHGCRVTLGGAFLVCTVTGTVASSYNNATSVLTVPTSSAWTFSSGTSSCPVTGPGHQTPLAFTVTSAPKPQITFTP